MRSKTKKFHLHEITYEESHWRLLHSMRENALEIMETLKEFSPIVHGSLARGDVHKDSDIDVVIPYVVPSCMLELCLASFSVLERRLIQATPWHLVKGSIVVPEGTVTFPMVEPKRVEQEFYRFGGFLSIDNLFKDERVPGVDKRLVFIEPTPEGHREFSICGKEHEVAKRLNVSIDIISERVKVLERRDKVGRTGIFLNKALLPDENFEQVLKSLTSTSTQLKRRAG